MIDVKRAQEAPPSLAKEKYNAPDVHEALYSSFLGKCYLCESCSEIFTFDVDHRLPQVDYPEHKYTWSNLFPACAKWRCNQRREKRYPPDGLLDPANGDQVKKRLTQKIEGIVSARLGEDTKSVRFVFAALAPDDVKAKNTAKELDRIHNGTGSTESAVLTSKSLRYVIQRQVLTIYQVVQEMSALTPEDTSKREELHNKLQKLFSRRAPYTMLVRSYFSHRPDLCALFDNET